MARPAATITALIALVLASAAPAAASSGPSAPGWAAARVANPAAESQNAREWPLTAISQRTQVAIDDFGREEIRDAGGSVVAATPTGLEYGFQGRRRDAETGWLYFRARFYDPGTGRFLSRDPVWDAANVGGWYSFVGNGPISGMDPSGLAKQPLHHIFPQQFRKTFDELFDAGFTDRFTIKLPLRQHQELHVEYEWNKKWQALLEGDEFACANDARKRSMVLEQVKRMAEETDLDLSAVRPYRGKLSGVKGSSAAEFAEYFKKNTTVSKRWVGKLAGGMFAAMIGVAMVLDDAAKIVASRRFQLALVEYKRSDDMRGDWHMKKFIYEDLPFLGLDGKATVAAQGVLSEAFGQ